MLESLSQRGRQRGEGGCQDYANILQSFKVRAEGVHCARARLGGGPGVSSRMRMVGIIRSHFNQACSFCPISYPLLSGGVLNISCPSLLSAWLPGHQPAHLFACLLLVLLIASKPLSTTLTLLILSCQLKYSRRHHLRLTLAHSIRHAHVSPPPGSPPELGVYPSASFYQKHGGTQEKSVKKKIVFSLCLRQDGAQAAPVQDRACGFSL